VFYVLFSYYSVGGLGGNNIILRIGFFTSVYCRCFNDVVFCSSMLSDCLLRDSNGYYVIKMASDLDGASAS
jgi:hypothetical protein